MIENQIFIAKKFHPAVKFRNTDRFFLWKLRLFHFICIKNLRFSGFSFHGLACYRKWMKLVV